MGGVCGAFSIAADCSQPLLSACCVPGSSRWGLANALVRARRRSSGIFLYGGQHTPTYQNQMHPSAYTAMETSYLKLPSVLLSAPWLPGPVCVSHFLIPGRWIWVAELGQASSWLGGGRGAQPLGLWVGRWWQIGLLWGGGLALFNRCYCGNALQVEFGFVLF